jgi:hypothetical protein
MKIQVGSFVKVRPALLVDRQDAVWIVIAVSEPKWGAVRVEERSAQGLSLPRIRSVGPEDLILCEPPQDPVREPRDRLTKLTAREADARYQERVRSNLWTGQPTHALGLDPSSRTYGTPYGVVTELEVLVWEGHVFDEIPKRLRLQFQWLRNAHA